MYGESILILIGGFILFPYAYAEREKIGIGILFIAILYLAIISFQVYQFIYACNARVIKDKIILKKQFREAKTYSFDKIGTPTSFQINHYGLKVP